MGSSMLTLGMTLPVSLGAVSARALIGMSMHVIRSATVSRVAFARIGPPVRTVFGPSLCAGAAN